MLTLFSPSRLSSLAEFLLHLNPHPFSSPLGERNLHVKPSLVVTNLSFDSIFQHQEWRGRGDWGGS